MNHLSFHEFPGLHSHVEYDAELEVYTIRLVTDGNQMVLILTPAQLSSLCDRLLESVCSSLNGVNLN
jgi:hypothetical protein